MNNDAINRLSDATILNQKAYEDKLVLNAKLIVLGLVGITAAAFVTNGITHDPAVVDVLGKIPGLIANGALKTAFYGSAAIIGGVPIIGATVDV